MKVVLSIVILFVISTSIFAAESVPRSQEKKNEGSEEKFKKPVIEQSFLPTNISINNSGTGPSCYLRLQSPLNPDVVNGTVKLRWAYSTNQGWTGMHSDRNVHFPDLNNNVKLSACSSNTANCISTASDGDELAADGAFFFAVQEVNVKNPKQKSKWSNEIECRPPAAPESN